MTSRRLTVRHQADDRFEVDIRGHIIHVDQPLADGGTDEAPTPTELFVASLASCVAFYARRFLARNDLSTDGLAVDATYTMDSKPARVGEILITLHVPDSVPSARRDALLAVASHCTVHNTITAGPRIDVTLLGSSAPALTAAGA